MRAAHRGRWIVGAALAALLAAGAGPPESLIPSVEPAAATEAGPLPFFYDLFTFRGRGDSTVVVAAYSVLAGRLERESDGDGVRYRFDVSLVLADTARREVVRSDDSVYVRVPSPLDGDHLLHTHVELQALPSTSVVHRVIMTDAATPGVGKLYRAALRIPDYGDRERLMLSDVALGRPGVAAGWQRRGNTLALLPTSQLPESSFDVFYEIYNLPAGRRYATEISVRPLDGDPEEAEERTVRTGFSERAVAGADGVVAELRRVDASLARGRYLLTVTVRDQESGRTASNSRVFHVRGWSEGATLVPALPWRAAAGG